MKFRSWTLTEPYAMDCPACDTLLAIGHRDYFRTLGDGFWLRDGDTIDMVNVLSEEQKKPSGFDCTLMVGKCRECQADYYAVEAAFMDADYTDAEPYLIGDVVPAGASFRMCELRKPEEPVPPAWLLRESAAGAGVLHKHTFGPFLLGDTTGVIGRNGVSSCGGGKAPAWDHAKGMLKAVWDDARRYVTARSRDAEMNRIRENIRSEISKPDSNH